MSKLPFAAGLFWKTLAVVVTVVVLTWWIVIRLTGYEITPADCGGTTISSILFSYLVHLWLLPGEHLHRDEEGPEEK
jgi:hypothetical protein